MLLEPYDANAAGYAEHLDPTLAAAAERLAELAEAGRATRLLDLATGTGAAARAAARRGAAVIGVDRSPGMLAVARELSPEIDLRRADACALPFDRGMFDAVVCGLSLSHFADREQALREVLRVLQPGGRLVASTWGEGSSFPTRAVAGLLDRYAVAPGVLDESTSLSPDRGSSELRRLGFESVSVRRESFTGSFVDTDEALAWSVAWPLTASRLARLDGVPASGSSAKRAKPWSARICAGDSCSISISRASVRCAEASVPLGCCGADEDEAPGAFWLGARFARGCGDATMGGRGDERRRVRERRGELRVRSGLVEACLTLRPALAP